VAFNTSRKGNAGENLVVRDLQAKGWVVGGRRHLGGAGDVLAVSQPIGRIGRALLVEVKKTQGPWDAFKPAARRELLIYAREHNLEPLLAWVGPGAKVPKYLRPAEWPPTPL
jgi:hypothetical protein